MGKRFMSHIVMVLLAAFIAGCGPSAFLIRSVPARRDLQETEIGRDKGAFIQNKIAVVDVDGFMVNRQKWGLLSNGDNPVSLFVEKLDKARSDRDVKAVVLRLNSPGGTVAASDIMYNKLKEFKRTSNKPVVACMLDTATSGAYYLACGSDGIMAQPSTITGSIGTIMQTVSFSGTMEKLGIKSVAIKSGKLKDMASPLHELSDEEREVLQGIITHFYEQFLGVVEDGRKELDGQKLRELADGRIYTAEEAHQAGLIDRIGYPSEAIAWAKEMAKVTKMRVVIYHRPIGYKPNIYSSDTGTSSGVQALLGTDLPDWLTASGVQFLYLWQPGMK